jgi:hypothetical protein
MRISALNRRFLGFFAGRAVMDGDASPFAGKAEGDGPADAFGSAGDQDDFSVEARQQVLPEVRSVPLLPWYEESGSKK